MLKKIALISMCSLLLGVPVFADNYYDDIPKDYEYSTTNNSITIEKFENQLNSKEKMIIEEFKLYLENKNFKLGSINDTNIDDFVDYVVSKGLIENTPEAKAEVKGLTKEFIRVTLKAVVTGGKICGLKLSASFLDHSLQDNPKDLSCKSGSWQSDLVELSYEYAELISDTKNELENCTEFFYGKRGSITFSSTKDLTLALHNVEYSLFAQKVDGRWKVSVVFKDVYDFDSKSWKKVNGIGDAAINALNKVGDIAEEYGAINNYNINIYIKRFID